MSGVQTFFFFQAEDGIRDRLVTGVQTCALPIYAVARVTKNLLTFAYFVIIARYAGVRVAGLFFLVLAYGTLYLTLTDFGFTNVFIRDTARHPEDIQKNFSKTLSVKLLFIAILLALTLVAFNILDYPPITKTLVYIVVASQKIGRAHV